VVHYDDFPRVDSFPFHAAARKQDGKLAAVSNFHWTRVPDHRERVDSLVNRDADGSDRCAIENAGRLMREDHGHEPNVIREITGRQQRTEVETRLKHD